MEIQINNQPQIISEDTTVQELISDVLQLDIAGMAIAINDQIVPRHLWENQKFNTNDQILIIKAARGG